MKNIRLYNVSKTHHSYILQDIFRFRGLIVGAPTYNAGLYHEMDVLLQEVANRDIKNHLIVGLVLTHGLQRLLLPLANGTRTISTLKR